jgi:hypothetical protein
VWRRTPGERAAAAFHHAFAGAAVSYSWADDLDREAKRFVTLPVLSGDGFTAKAGNAAAAKKLRPSWRRLGLHGTNMFSELAASIGADVRERATTAHIIKTRQVMRARVAL